MVKTLLRGLGFGRQPQRLPDVIYLGYDNRDNVGSMRLALQNRVERGDIRLL